ncbi:MAG: hypothetical protein BMS9Abin10_0548 [Gammaproteobacteria bacterium]|nr:MAG: hypothetical protein BMS9Abin10_0548 [Gammaproteobacteria bacterium]
MRWLFGTLLLLNVGLLMWGSWYQNAPVERGPPSRPLVSPEKMTPLAEDVTVRGQQPRVRSDAQRGAAGGIQRGNVCVSIGPFKTRDRAQAAAGTLKEKDLAYRHREQVERTTVSYRVFLPPLSSRAAAEEKRQRLSRLGFREHYVIEEPGKENAISLGVFAVRQNAWALAQKLAGNGISAKQETLYDTATLYWLDLELGPQDFAKLRTLQWADIDVGLHEQSCAGVPASTVGDQPVEEGAPG